MIKDIVIHNRFNRPKTIPWPVGDGTAPIFEEVYVDGVRELRMTGRNPLNEFVQSSLEETQIYNILNRYVRGDISALDKVHGMFMDVVGMPTNLAEAQQALINIERKFDVLPGEVKAKFNNNVKEFVNVVANGKLDEVLKDFKIPANNDEGGEGNA